MMKSDDMREGGSYSLDDVIKKKHYFRAIFVKLSYW
jgi:hypothetical protein